MEKYAREQFEKGYPVRFVRSRSGWSRWGWQSAAFSSPWLTFDELKARETEPSFGEVRVEGHWETAAPSHQTQVEAAGHIFRREPFEIGHLSGTAFFDPGAAGIFGDLPEKYVQRFLADYEDGGVAYVVWSYETVVAWVVDDGRIAFPPVRYSNTTTQHQYLVARALRQEFASTESARKGKGKTPYTHREGW
jgi:hypothetical protein